MGRRCGMRRCRAIFLAAAGTALCSPAFAQTRTQGIDISHFQNQATAGNVLNFNSVATTSAKQFVYIKSSEGMTVDDAFTNQNVAGATAAGMIAGIYHLAHPE